MDLEDIYQRRRKSSLVFPFEPYTERGSFIKFIEESGVADIYFDLFTALYNENLRPEDSEKWLYNYFRSLAPSRKEEIEESIEAYKQELLSLETEIQNYLYQDSGKEDDVQEEERTLTTEPSTFGSFLGQQKSTHTTQHPHEASSKAKVPIVSENISNISSFHKTEMFVPTASSEIINESGIKSSLKVPLKPIMDPEFSEQGNDPRWQFRPSPMYRPEPLHTYEQIQQQKPVESEIFIEPSDDPNALEIEKDFKALASPTDPERLKELYEKYEIVAEAKLLPLKPSTVIQFGALFQSKSTETSPQVSNMHVPALESRQVSVLSHQTEHTKEADDIEQSEEEDGIIKPDSPIVPPDSDFLERKIPSNFWTLDFSLKKAIRTNLEDENDRGKDFMKERILGKPYKIRPIDEHSWLPERELYASELVKQMKQLPTQVFEESVAGSEDEDAEEKELNMTAGVPIQKETKVAETVPLDKDKTVGEIRTSKPRRMSLAEYEWITKKHGVQYLRNLIKRTDIYHTGEGDAGIDTNLAFDPCV